MSINKEKIIQTVASVKKHWSTPPEGRYVPYKEILAYSAGGIGVKSVIFTIYYIGLSATSLLAGSALGLKNGDLVKLNIIATVIGLFLGPLRGYIIDNTRSSKGKFRPYLLYTGIPSGVLITIFAFCRLRLCLIIRNFGHYSLHICFFSFAIRFMTRLMQRLFR